MAASKRRRARGPSLWTSARLERLYTRYNRRYWRGRLPVLAVSNQHLDDCVGVTERSPLRISVDVAQHRTDREVRGTLLHEMAHVADRARHKVGHGYGFWTEIERLLRQRAPITIGCPEMPGHAFITALSVPRRLRLSRQALERTRRRLEREIPAGLPEQLVTDTEILGAFEDAATDGLTWSRARRAVGLEYGLLDVEHNPIDAWARRLLARAEHRVREARRAVPAARRRRASLR